MSKLKVLSLFSGIGAFEKALKNIGIDYDLIGFSEIDKFAIKSYCAIHGVDESLNLGDVSLIDLDLLPQNIDIIVHASPCQDYSVSGKGKGGDEGSGTRSSLMWHGVRIIKYCKPKYIIWENVKNVLSKKHIHNFNRYIDDLNDTGYTSYYKILNAKDFGVPQNRERIFVISIRKDLEQDFEFPKGEGLKICLKDILEKEVESKYYLSEEHTKRFVESSKKSKYPMGKEYTVLGTTVENEEEKGTNSRHWVYDINGAVSTLTATDYKQSKQIMEMKPVRLGGVFDSEKSKHQAGSIWDKNYISPTLDTMQGGWRHPLITEESQFKIRRLTPLECWRLMGFDDEDFYKAQKVPTSNTQLYKQAGNSIVVPILEKIFQNLFK